MKRIIFILVLFFFGSNICAKEYFVHSPNKRIEVRVNVSNGVRYNVFFNNDTVLKDCSMSLNVLDDEKRIPLRVKKLNRYSVNEKIKKEIPLNGLYAYNKCNVLVLELNNESVLNLGLLIMVLLIDMFQIKREILIFSLRIVVLISLKII